MSTHISATTSIPAEKLQQGILEQVYVRGVIRHGMTVLPLMSIEMDQGNPVAWFAIGPGGGPRDDGTYPLHLEETLDLEGSPAIRLVSFDVVNDYQAVTIFYPHY